MTNLIHETKHGVWHVQRAFHPALGVMGIVTYCSRDCQNGGAWQIDETGVCEDRTARVGNARKVPALVRRAAMKEIARQQKERVEREQRESIVKELEERKRLDI